MSDIQKELNEYKNFSVFKLKCIRNLYVFLSYMNSDKVNFFFTFFNILIFLLFFSNINFLTFLLFFIIHYFLFWKYLILHKKFKLVSDKDKEEIDEIIFILNKWIKNKNTNS